MIFTIKFQFWPFPRPKTNWDMKPNLRFVRFDNKTEKGLRDIDLGLIKEEECLNQKCCQLNLHDTFFFHSNDLPPAK